jgi:hypothetical protein
MQQFFRAPLRGLDPDLHADPLGDVAARLALAALEVPDVAGPDSKDFTGLREGSIPAPLTKALSWTHGRY